MLQWLSHCLCSELFEFLANVFVQSPIFTKLLTRFVQLSKYFDFSHFLCCSKSFSFDKTRMSIGHFVSVFDFGACERIYHRSNPYGTQQPPQSFRLNAQNFDFFRLISKTGSYAGHSITYLCSRNYPIRNQIFC